LASLFRSPI